MNKILKSFLFFTMILVTMVSCREDDDMPSPGTPINPEKEIAGTYSGLWTKTNIGTGAVDELPGVIIIEASDIPYVVTITVKSDDGSIDKSASANVVKKSGGYRFYNEMTNHGIGTTFMGEVSFDGKASINYTVTERSGKRTVKNKYDFAGGK